MIPFLFFQPHQIGMTWQYNIEWHQGRRRHQRYQTGNGSNSTGSYIQLQPQQTQQRKSIVVVTSKPRSQMEDSLISVKGWTNFEMASNIHFANKEDVDFPRNGTQAKNEAKNMQKGPLAIYAQVLRGKSPILKAKVMATITVEQTNGSSITLSPIQLYDNGFGGEFSFNFHYFKHKCMV